MTLFIFTIKVKEIIYFKKFTSLEIPGWAPLCSVPKDGSIWQRANRAKKKKARKLNGSCVSGTLLFRAL